MFPHHWSHDPDHWLLKNGVITAHLEHPHLHSPDVGNIVTAKIAKPTRTSQWTSPVHQSSVTVIVLHGDPRRITPSSSFLRDSLSLRILSDPRIALSGLRARLINIKIRHVAYLCVQSREGRDLWPNPALLA